MRLIIGCLGDFVDKNNAAITAISTVVIALFTTILGVFTVKLASATRVAALAAHDSAIALTQSERAHMFAEIASDNVTDAIREITGKGLQKDAVPSVPITVGFYFKNHGKTPAILKAICRDFSYWAAPPPWDACLTGNLPVVGLPTERDRVIDPDKETWQLSCEATSMSVRDAESIIRRHTYFWFYGRIIYNDIFGTEHEHRFIFRRDKDGRLSAFDHPDYSKNT